MKNILPFKELYGVENEQFEKYMDIFNDNNKVYKRLYIKYNNVNETLINQLINVLTIQENFILDKVDKKKIELVNSKTGNIRYYIWSNRCVEIYKQEFIGIK